MKTYHHDHRTHSSQIQMKMPMFHAAASAMTMRWSKMTDCTAHKRMRRIAENELRCHRQPTSDSHGDWRPHCRMPNHYIRCCCGIGHSSLRRPEDRLSLWWH